MTILGNNFDKTELKNVLAQYDNALYSEYDKGVIIVEKNGFYGVVNLKGEEIIPCVHREYSDVWHEWKDTGFSTSKVALMSQEDIARAELKATLKATRQQLIAQGDIKEIPFYNDRAINGAVFVRLGNGDIGIAASVIVWDGERGKQLEIKGADGEHIAFINEPELMQGRGTPQVKICTDDDNLYVGSYGNEYSFLACYRMGDFEQVWKTSLPGSRLQSITVNDNNIIAFDIGLTGSDGTIKYFNKTTGEYAKDKDIATKEEKGGFTVTSHHNLAATNKNLLAVVPGLSFGIDIGLPKFDNEIKSFDNVSGEMLHKKSVPINFGTLNAVAIDENQGRAYLAFDDKIGVFSADGYEGMILAPTRNVLELDVDKQTGCLMISMKDGKGKVDVCSPQAIETLLKTSQQLGSDQETTGKLPGR